MIVDSLHLEKIDGSKKVYQPWITVVPSIERCLITDTAMSSHLHGNAQTAVKDRQIRQELLNTDFEVIEVQYQELFDKTVMRSHMRRIARAVVGKNKAKELEADDSWFDSAEASRD